MCATITPPAYKNINIQHMCFSMVERVGRTSRFRIDLKCPEMRSKVIFKHPKWPIVLKCLEM